MIASLCKVTCVLAAGVLYFAYLAIRDGRRAMRELKVNTPISKANIGDDS